MWTDNTRRRYARADLLLPVIGWRHRQAGGVPPTARDARMVIADTLAGIRREQRPRALPSAKKDAIGAVDLTAMIGAIRGMGSKAVRDRAILALGLASALRRSELVALQLADVQLVKEGARITVRSSKTDQEGDDRHSQWDHDPAGGAAQGVAYG